MRTKTKISVGVLTLVVLLAAATFTGTKYLQGSLASPYLRGPFTTLTVTKTADTLDGSCDAQDCSLREAVMASWDDTHDYLIDIPAGTYTLTLPNVNGNEFANASGDLNFYGNNHLVIMQGASTGSTIIDGDGLSLNDRVIAVVGNSAGQVVFAHLTIQGGYFPSGNGGGIYNQVAPLALTDVVVKDNQTYQGGNVYNNNGTLTVIDSVIMAGIANAEGGGIANYSGGIVEISSSQITSNVAGTYGGGIYNDYRNSESVTIDDSEISANEASNGGGINNGGTLTMTSSRVFENHASNGGGVYNNGVLSIDGSTIGVNVASNGSGGGVFSQGAVMNATTVSILNSTLDSNEASYVGGGFYDLESDSFSIVDSTVSNNHSLNGGGGHSGGLSSNLIVDGSTFSSNIADIRGGALYLYGSFSSNLNSTSISRSSFKSNSTVSAGGAIYQQEGALEVLTSSFRDNKVLDGCVYNDVPVTLYCTEGGGALLVNSGIADIAQSLFAGNSSKGNGGAIINLGGGSLNVENSTFFKNSTLDSVAMGGAVFNSDGTSTLSFVTLAKNSSYNGGALYFGAGVLQIMNSILSGNIDTGTNLSENCRGAIPVVSMGHNMEDGTTCALSGAGDLSSTVARLAVAPANNGGLTQTISLMPRSPAIDAGVCTDIAGNAVTIDQRGVTRGALCDIGAYER